MAFPCVFLTLHSHSEVTELQCQSPHMTPSLCCASVVLEPSSSNASFPLYLLIIGHLLAPMTSSDSLRMRLDMDEIILKYRRCRRACVLFSQRPNKPVFKNTYADEADGET